MICGLNAVKTKSPAWFSASAETALKTARGDSLQPTQPKYTFLSMVDNTIRPMVDWLSVAQP
jgi:hypothetical protein